MDKKQSGKLFLLSAPSGCGKTTLTYKLLALLSSEYNISRVITYTTRAPRSSDRKDIDYHFLSLDEFKSKIDEKFFLEWSNAYGDYYGTPADLIQRIEGGFSYIAVVNCVGVCSILKKYRKAIPIWIAPPSVLVLEQRLRSRKSESEEQIKKRLDLAKKEIEEKQSVSFYKYSVLNDIFDRTLSELKNIIKCELVSKK